MCYSVYNTERLRSIDFSIPFPAKHFFHCHQVFSYVFFFFFFPAEAIINCYVTLCLIGHQASKINYVQFLQNGNEMRPFL